MSKSNLFLKLDLQLFAEGGGTAGAGAGVGGTGADGATGVNAGVPDLQNGVKNPLADVKYGIQDDAQTANVQSKITDGDGNTVTSVDRNEEFEKLIKGEYKDLYDARVQDTVQKRLKSSKETVDKYNELTPTIEMLARKYGVDASDIKALNKAIEEDDSYYEDEALEKGVTVEQLKSIRKMEKENAELKRQMSERAEQEQVDRDVAQWMEQAKEAQKVFPSLDLGAELKNPQFIGMLKSGVGMEAAYFALHHNELVPQAMQFTAKQVEQKLTNKIIAGGARPAENGMSQTSASQVKSDVSQLSKADREEIIRRVARGEKIRF